MFFVIATKPGRAVRNQRNAVQKFVQVRADGKFKFVTDANQATLFRTASDLLRAVGIRARTLVNGSRRAGVTSDLTWAEAQQAGVQITRIYNGG